MAAILTGQTTTAYTDLGSSVDVSAPGNVTVGNRIILFVNDCYDTLGPRAAGDVAKLSGTATIGTVVRDAVETRATDDVHAHVFSIPVTGAGTLTLRVSGFEGSSYIRCVFTEWSALEAALGSGTGTAATGAPSTSSYAASEPGVFIGTVSTFYLSGSQTHTPGADYTQIAENEDSTHMTGAEEYRIVSGATTDAADWQAPTTVPWAAAMAFYKNADLFPYDHDGVKPWSSVWRPGRI
jgi:hypothetical protein